MTGRPDYKEEQSAASATLAGRGSPTLAKVDISTATTTAVIAATAAKKIKIVKILLVSDAANTVVLKDDTTALTGAMTMNAGAVIGFDGDHSPMIITTNKAFNITTSQSEQLSGFILYYKEA